MSPLLSAILVSLQWLAVLEIVSVAGWGIAWHAFSRFPDRGWGIARVFGLMLTAFLVWWASNLGILSNSGWAWWLCGGVLAVVSIVILLRDRRRVGLFVRSQFRSLVVAEILFLSVFVGLVAFKFFDPAISGTEKPAELMFLNAATSTPNAPPNDHWLSGMSVSYYYFGYWIFGGLSQMSAVTTAYGFNLAIASVMALSATVAFSVIYALTHSKKMAVAATVVLLFAASFGAWWELLAGLGYGSAGFYEWLAIDGLTPNSQGFFWWWRLSRIINTFNEAGQSLDYTIQEFPAFSLILGDLHPHFMSIPLVLTFIGLVVNVWHVNEKPSWRWLKRNKLLALALSFTLGAAGFMNAWDLAFLSAILFATVFLLLYLQRGSYRGHSLLKVFTFAVATVLVSLAIGWLLFLPFYPPFGTFETAPSSPYFGITEITTRPIHAWTVWGIFALVVLPFIAVRVYRAFRSDRGKIAEPTHTLNKRILLNFMLLLLILGLPLALWVVRNLFVNLDNGVFPDTLFGGDNPLIRVDLALLTREYGLTLTSRLIVPVIFGALAAISFKLAITSKPMTKLTRYALILLSVSLYALFLTELFFVVDPFGSRLNTVFKVYYQVWMLLSVVGAYVFWTFLRAMLNGNKTRTFAWVGVLAITLALIGPFYYTVAALSDKADSASVQDGLNGTVYLKRNSAADFEAIMWLQASANSPTTVAEAHGGSYTDAGRISTYAGLPTVLGWVGHERLWRQNHNEITDRENDLQVIYTGQDAEQINQTLQKYGINYIILGCRERAKYKIAPNDSGNTLFTVTVPVFVSDAECASKQHIQILSVLE